MINNVVLMGRLTAAPELKSTQSGTSVLSFTLAIDRKFQKDGEKQADFINCVAWRQTAEFICKHFNKGDLIAVTGEIQTRKYEYEGKNRFATEVVINEASFCGGKNKSNEAGNNEPDIFENYGDDFIPTAGDDLPF